MLAAVPDYDEVPPVHRGLGESLRIAIFGHTHLDHRLSTEGEPLHRLRVEHSEVLDRSFGLNSGDTSANGNMRRSIPLTLAAVALVAVLFCSGVVLVNQIASWTQVSAAVQLMASDEFVEASATSQLRATKQVVDVAHTGSTQQVFHMAMMAFPSAGAQDCTAAQVQDLDYEAHQLYQMEFVMSAEECMSRCEKNTECNVWAWDGSEGATLNVCFLRQLHRDEQVLKHPRRSVVSGQICRFPNLSDRVVGTVAAARQTSIKHAAITAASTTTTLTRTETFTTTVSTVATTPTTLATTSTHNLVVAEFAHQEQLPGPGRNFFLPAMAYSRQEKGSLFCFTLFIAGSYEEELLFAQYNQGASVFACDDFEIYTNSTMELAPGVPTRQVNSSLHCTLGGEFKTALNTGIFMKVWRTVTNDGKFLNHDWTVKVDADSVFLPDRLRPLIRLYEAKANTGAGVYLNNCQFGLHGPIEVLSRAAVKMWVANMEFCQSHFNKMCSGDCLWGEDMFLDQCLWKVLKSTRIDEFRLLLEDHCAPPSGWDACIDPTAVAFHPFKSKDRYLECLSNALVNTQIDSTIQVKK